MKKTIISMLAFGCLSIGQAVKAQSWNLTGNAGTNPTTDFIGTTDAKVFKIKTNNVVRMYFKSNGDIGIGTSAPTSKFHVNGVITATGGTSSDWNTAFSWGNHALAGYLTAESDPQVGANTLGYVPRWNGSALVTSNIFTNGTEVSVNTNTTIGNAQFTVSSATNGYGGMYVNTTGASGGLPFYGYAVNGSPTCWTYYKQNTGDFTVYNNGDQLSIESDGDVKIGKTASTGSRLDVLGSTSSTLPTINVASNYTASNVDVPGILSSSVVAPGYGYGVRGTGGYMGVYGNADASTYTGGAFGVYGYASGTAGTRYGVYGTATGGTENWGGYFATKAFATEMRVGGTQGATGYVLAVNGKAIAEEVRVELKATWPDYVFGDDYKLMPLEQLKNEIEANNHLPGMPSADEMCEEGGIDLGEMQTRLVEKVEELTLYILQLKEQNDKLSKANEALQQRVTAIENK